MAVPVYMEIQEAREAYHMPRREAGIRLGCGGRTLEAYEYRRARTPIEVVRKAAEEFRSPELLEQSWDEYPQEWPRIPLPEHIESSLLANAAKGVKEAGEKARALQELMMEAYGKESEPDLTQKDKQLIEAVLGEGAQSVRAYKKLCFVLVKQYGYSMNEIDKIIARYLMGGQKNKAVSAASK